MATERCFLKGSRRGCLSVMTGVGRKTLFKSFSMGPFTKGFPCKFFNPFLPLRPGFPSIHRCCRACASGLSKNSCRTGMASGAVNHPAWPQPWLQFDPARRQRLPRRHRASGHRPGAGRGLREDNEAWCSPACSCSTPIPSHAFEKAHGRMDRQGGRLSLPVRLRRQFRPAADHRRRHDTPVYLDSLAHMSLVGRRARPRRHPRMPFATTTPRTWSADAQARPRRSGGRFGLQHHRRAVPAARR